MQSSVPENQAIDAARAPRVLVVEDEFLVRMVIADRLREAGFTVIEAFNGDEAIAILASGASVDLVLTDVRMPGTADGIAVLSFVKQTCPEVPVVVTSGHLEAEIAYEEGAIHFLPKPCALDAIVEAMRAALEPSK
jgi:DNA-binding NtrC family response regulator